MKKHLESMQLIKPNTQKTTKNENIRETKALGEDVVFLPKNLNFEKLTKGNKPNFKFDIKKGKYIISLIVSNTASYIGKDKKRQFVQINSAKLSHIIHDYSKYIKYFLETGVIKKGSNFRVGKKCNEYHLNEIYISKTIVERITSKFLKKSKKDEEIRQSITMYPYLGKWYDGLEIDYTSALQYIEDFESGLVKNMANDSRSLKQKKTQSWSFNIEKIYNKSYYFKSCPNSKRFFTPLTNLKKDLRKYLTYKGKPLVSIDLSCSQPFLLLALLNANFYEENTFNITESVWQKLQKVKSVVASYINQNFSENDEELLRYKDMVAKGVLYDEMIKLCNKDFNKDKIKEVLFTIFYSSNYSKNVETVKNKEIFKNIFPKIFKLIEILKKNEHNIFAITLQSIESEIFLNRISKKISDKSPNIPFFTIHDSIIVLQSNKEYTEKIVYNELHNAIGLEPNLKIEEWI